MRLGGTTQEFWDSEAAYERYLANEQDRRDNDEDEPEDPWPEPDSFNLGD